MIIYILAFFHKGFHRILILHFGFKDKIDPYYFSFTTMSTVGYGDLRPKTRRAKLLGMTQQLLLLTGEITLLFKYFRK